MAGEERQVAQPLPSRCRRPSHLSWCSSRGEGHSPGAPPPGLLSTAFHPSPGPATFGAQPQGSVQEAAHFHRACPTRVHTHTHAPTLATPPPSTGKERGKGDTGGKRALGAKERSLHLSGLRAASSSAEARERIAHIPGGPRRVRGGHSHTRFSPALAPVNLS